MGLELYSASQFEKVPFSGTDLVDGISPQFIRCYQNNKFSSLFGGVPYVHGAAEFLEVGPPISLGGDILASGAKATGKTLGKPQPYASGLNAGFRFVGDLAGSPSLKGTLVGIGDKVTPPLAVVGTFTGSYNATIMVECGCGVIK